jgi:peptide/nickel transport system permease protein
VPPLTYIPFYEDPIANLSQFILPAIAISVFTLAIVMRMVRATMLEVLGQDYVRTAGQRAPGGRSSPARASKRTDPRRHVVGFEVGVLISGAAIVEIIFGLPGVGYTLLHAIFQRDYPMIQAATLLIATVFVVVNFMVDILYGYLDPRISVG